MNNAVALTILQQLGGSRFVAMTGAKNMVSTADSLRITFPANFAKNGIRYMLIKLTAADDYTVTFAKGRGIEWKPVAEFEGIYCDSLVELFERQTGLCASL